MKRLLLAAGVVWVVGLAPLAYADGGPGCGVGSEIFAGEGGVVPQELALTTNGAFSNTFAITSGTSGCSADGVVLRQHERQVFAAVNFRNLKTDMAKGKGEYLTALAVLMGVDAADRPAFDRFSKLRYTALVGGAEASSSALLSALDAELANHPRLSRYGNETP